MAVINNQERNIILFRKILNFISIQRRRRFKVGRKRVKQPISCRTLFKKEKP